VFTVDLLSCGESVTFSPVVFIVEQLLCGNIVSFLLWCLRLICYCVVRVSFSPVVFTVEPLLCGETVCLRLICYRVVRVWLFLLWCSQLNCYCVVRVWVFLLWCLWLDCFFFSSCIFCCSLYTKHANLLGDGLIICTIVSKSMITRCSLYWNRKNTFVRCRPQCSALQWKRKVINMDIIWHTTASKYWNLDQFKKQTCN